ncbi:hypothetical protein GQ600_27911 [Phytophthora cactorum]|nr:hypothetical protein GQ600_27911 [Phytophthora cactorum]
MVFGLTKYLTSSRMFIESEDSYFAFSFEDAVMVGGCTDCQNLYTMDFSNYSRLSSEMLALVDTLEGDGTVCMSGFDEHPADTDVESVVMPHVLLEAEVAVDTAVDCPSDWVLEAHLRLFKFPTAKASSEFSAVSAAGFTIFPEQTNPHVVPVQLRKQPACCATDDPRTTESYDKILQPLFHGYYGGCRVRENYGLMIQAPDDLPVCSTGDVCVHNYYNSIWEFVTGRQAQYVPGIVVTQILVMGVISLYQVLSHKRSVLLTQIWAYRCQNGRMQMLYLAQIPYHIITTLINLAFCFFVFSYSFVNLAKARSGEQQLARHFRLTWETMQVVITMFTIVGLYRVRQTSLVSILNQNGGLLRKTTARGAAVCNLSDSCIVFKHNLVLNHAQWEAHRIAINAGKSSPNMRSVVPTGPSHDFLKASPRPAFRRPGNSVEPDAPAKSTAGPSVACPPFSKLFTDCSDIAYTTYEGRRCSTVEAILLTGFLFYGEHVYQAQDAVLLLFERLLPRKLTRTFNILFVRWYVNKRTGGLSNPQSCTWFRASDDAFRLMEARPIA